MSEFEREELLSILSDAAPALSSRGTLPELTHFWFDKKHIYAYDGGLGVRLGVETDLDCGLPGKTLINLLRTSSLKQVFLDDVQKQVVLQMGKAKVALAPLDTDRLPWPFPDKAGANTKTIILSEGVVEALNQIKFVRTSSPERPMHHGIVTIASKTNIDFYASDSKTIAKAEVDERPGAVPKFIMPWAFVDRILDLIEPGAPLYVMEDCLMVDTEGVRICSNVLDASELPDLAKTVTDHAVAPSKAVGIPPGLQAVLDRANILAGSDEAVVTLSSKGDTLQVQGKYIQGSLNEKLTLKGKLGDVSAKFNAALILRALGVVDTFALTPRALTFHSDTFVYMVSAKS